MQKLKVCGNLYAKDLFLNYNYKDLFMKNNSVVTASDRNYIWGVFLLIASMRKNGMDEPVVVLGQNYLPEDYELLQQFSDVKVFEAKPTKRSLVCSKAEAMLHADTEFATWVDCDGFFSGNVSKLLPPPSPEIIHIRKRSPEENAIAFNKHRYGESGKTIPKQILEEWKKDIDNANETSALEQCCSDCFLSINMAEKRDFIEAWDAQMKKVLPEGNVGVVNNALNWYHQVDESVINSLLCFRPNAPKVIDSYQMDKDRNALYVHFVCHPKPWVSWTAFSFHHYEAYCDVVDFILENNLKLPGGKLPLALQRKHKCLNRLLQYPVWFKHKFGRLCKKFK